MSNLDPEQIRADIGRWKREIQTWRTQAGLTDAHPNISRRLARIRVAEELLKRDTAPRVSAPNCPECKAMTGTRHLDGCSAQCREDYVGGDA
jgi:hypothetical protein